MDTGFEYIGTAAQLANIADLVVQVAYLSIAAKSALASLTE